MNIAVGDKMKNNNEHIISLLADILSDKSHRYQKVTDFVTTVMQCDKAENGKYQYPDAINDLAYDLDFYDPNPEMQKKYGFYGDERLEILITNAIKELKGHNKAACA